MPHKSGYGNSKKMPKKNDSYEGSMYEGDSKGGMPVTQSDSSYFRPMDSYPTGKNPHEY